MKGTLLFVTLVFLIFGSACEAQVPANGTPPQANQTPPLPGTAPGSNQPTATRKRQVAVTGTGTAAQTAPKTEPPAPQQSGKLHNTVLIASAMKSSEGVVSDQPFRAPLKAYVEYDGFFTPRSGRPAHLALDFAAFHDWRRQPVLAMQSGWVVFSGFSFDSGYGYGIIVKFDENRYYQEAEIDEVTVPANTWVNQGDIIGYVHKGSGMSSGPHVHFMIGKDWHIEYIQTTRNVNRNGKWKKEKVLMAKGFVTNLVDWNEFQKKFPGAWQRYTGRWVGRKK